MPDFQCRNVYAFEAKLQWQEVEGFVAAIPEEPVDEGLLGERGIPDPRWAVNDITFVTCRTGETVQL